VSSFRSKTNTFKCSFIELETIGFYLQLDSILVKWNLGAELRVIDERINLAANEEKFPSQYDCLQKKVFFQFHGHKSIV